ncbi:MAG: protein-ADP-ribose hydrolase [Eggerthellaceae bacterium]|nr:protein-ADP-ribose hydrolase [Eggerthellaceae bacterium]
MDESRKQELLELLTGEHGSSERLWDTFRAYVNTRPPEPAPAEWLAAQDELLQGMIADAGVSTVEDAAPAPGDPRVALWRGDITTFAADAIVNAANSQMLGCWVPGHYCIDNAIHTFAGVQLRRECYELMLAQGHEEPTGQAKITGAWNLPSKHVIHTVGPIAAGHPSDLHRSQLASSYRSCLDLAAENGLHTIAFCCISTGVFGFPAAKAAEIATATVRDWLDARPQAGMCVVFNVFGENDERLYRELMGL